MKSFFPAIRKLCTPAYVYLVISMIALVVIALQNVTSSTTYCVGNYSCPVQNNALLFIIKVLYIAFWTWILNLICKAGAPIVSWILVLLPFVLMFLLIASFIFMNGRLPVTRP
jgi:hypothetical protein